MADLAFKLEKTKREIEGDIQAFELHSRINPMDSKLREETQANLNCAMAFCNLLDVWFRIARFDGVISRRLEGLK